MIPWITAEQVNRTLQPAGAVEALRAALTAGFDPAGDLPRTIAPVRHGSLLLMPADAGRHAGVKIATVSPDNPGRALPRIQGLYLLHDAETLTPQAIIDGAALTTLRTPAVSIAAVAGVLRQRFDAPVDVALFGVGPQALGHVLALETVVPIRRVSVAVRAAGRSANLAAALERHGIAASETMSGTDESNDAVAGADVVITATTAREPLFDGSRVADRTVVIAIGSHETDARELDAGLMGRARVLVESRESALRECGDVTLAIDEGTVDAASLLPMYQVVTGGAPVAGGAPVVFKGSGMAWEDLVVASAIFDRMDEAGAGR